MTRIERTTRYLVAGVAASHALTKVVDSLHDRMTEYRLVITLARFVPVVTAIHNNSTIGNTGRVNELIKSNQMYNYTINLLYSMFI